MPQLLLSRGVSPRQQYLKKCVSRLRLGPYFLVSSLVAFVVLITVVTLAFSTRQVTKGYQLSSLDVHRQTLLRENEVKDMQISQARSLKFIEQHQRVKRMYKPGEVVFVNVESAIASR